MAGNVEVEAVYAVRRGGGQEDERIARLQLNHHRLLWHGSRTSNLISIFHRGLLIAPREAISLAGAAFGQVSAFTLSWGGPSQRA